MEHTIHCSLVVRGVQSTWSFDFLRDDENKPYIEIGKDKDEKVILYFLDESEIQPDRLKREGHLEYRKQIVVS